MSTVWGLGVKELGVAVVLPIAAGAGRACCVFLDNAEFRGLEGDGGGPGRALKLRPWWLLLYWVILSAWLEESINCPLDLLERFLPLLEAASSGRAGGCRRLCCFCFVLRLGLCWICRVLSARALPAFCPQNAVCVGDCAVPPLPVSSAALLAPGWSPDPLGPGIAGANIPFPWLVAALLCLTVQTPFPALSGPWAVFFGPGLSVFGALRTRGSSAVPDPWQLRCALGCRSATEGAGDVSGSCGAHSPGEAAFGFGDHLGKAVRDN